MKWHIIAFRDFKDHLCILHYRLEEIDYFYERNHHNYNFWVPRIAYTSYTIILGQYSY